MNRIERKFKDLRNIKKKAFITFITAGYPDMATTKKLVLEFTRIGVDIIELGVPFSDPMADGPVIQEASQRALKNKVTLPSILKLVKEVRKHTQVPICLMTYYNPIFCYGDQRFARQAKACGVDGVIIPDLPPDEGRDFVRVANKYGIDVICFIAPTTSPKRVRYIANVARGFIYYVSLTGVTGARRELPGDILKNLNEIKKITSKPICVGFGVSTPEQVKNVAKTSDGVIVGSAIVKRIKENIGRADLVKRVGRFVKKINRT